MDDYSYWSLIPPIIAIGFAIKTKQVVFSLSIGIFAGYLIISNGNPFDGFLATINSFVKVFESAGNTRTVILTLIIGALIQLIQYSGGVAGFIRLIQEKFGDKKNFTNRIQAITALTGFLIFVESNISILTVGTIFRPIFDKLKLPREKLAYLADSSSSPSCVLFPLNAWGAYIMGLIMIYDQLDPFQVLLFSIPFNFYAITTLAFVFWIAFSQRDFGPMKKAISISLEEDENSVQMPVSSFWNMVIPILVMVISMPLYLVSSGWDDEFVGGFWSKVWNSIGNGSGSESVLFSCFTAFMTGSIMYFIQKRINLSSFIDQSFKGMKDMLVMAVLMVLAFALGNLCNELGTGQYVANETSAWLIPELAPVLLFIISAFIAFSTGTSWGTFAIMVSIGFPLAFSVDANIYLVMAAILGGGVFGDHCSPISDTTLIASLAAGCDHIDHVRTQLPYALFTGGISVILYLIAGFIF